MLPLLMLLFLGSCIKQDDKIFRGEEVEFDAATWNPNTSGRSYPLLSNVPPFGVPVSTTADPVIQRTSGTIRFRVNLNGAQRSSQLVIPVSVFAAETTAILGTHYSALAAVTIPANSSFGECVVNILNPGVSSATPVELVLELGNSGSVIASPNFRRLGLRIRQQ